MSKSSLRLSEKWFNRALWLVAIIFASFLIGLGSLIVGDLPRVEKVVVLDDFIDRPAASAVRARIKAIEADNTAIEAEEERTALRTEAARKAYAAAQDTYRNWLATRGATEQGDQNPEVIARTQELDKLKAVQRQSEIAREKLDERALGAKNQLIKERAALFELESAAQTKVDAAQRTQEMRVFGYRLALTLPLLAIAGWLFMRKRKSANWPFVWGFIFFALFAFFVELVPYLPSYGGYIRYIVGIVLTFIAGHYAIRALQRYLAQQKEQEAAPEAERREQLDYEVAHARLAKAVCPGCERGFDAKSTDNNFCAHCGLGIFNNCVKCERRKNAFSRYCYGCGTESESAQAAQAVQAPAAAA
jgi:hypothetical protein